METMDNLKSELNITFDDRSQKALMSTGKWAQILGICCLIMAGVYFLYFAYIIFQSYQQVTYYSYPGSRNYIGLLFLLSGIGILLSSVFIYSFVTYNRFGLRLKKSVEQGRQDILIQGFKSLNTVFVYQSILMIISVVVGVISLVVRL